MPTTSTSFNTNINARPEVVFAYVADLTQHGEWTANPVQIEALASGPVTVGSRYRSTARVNGILFTAELRVTEYQPPTRFAFVGEDKTGKFEHQFTLRSDQGGTRVERKINFTLTLSQWLMFQILLYPVRLPAGKKALHLLKDRLEQAES
jgi:uncharacterized protein YndB with AHSA1/START domain